MSNKTRISELEKEIKKNQELYYNNKPVISDMEFDALVDELSKLDPENPLLTTVVGSDHTEGFKKVTHNIVMGSQSKANTEPEMNSWIRTIDPSMVLGSFKMDGNSVCLTYQNGKLVRAASRGDGCLDFNTAIETDKGKLTIGEIVENNINCNVKAWDFLNNKIIFTPIKNWFINENNFKWYELETDDGKKIKITGNHKVWVTNKNDWIRVEDLEEGDDFIVKD